MSMRYARHQALPAQAASAMPDHLRGDRGLIDKHQAPRIEAGLLGLQLGAGSGDVRTILLGGAKRFFE